jgi:hypothetical protein
MDSAERGPSECFQTTQLGTLIRDPITAAMIHSMGALFINDTDLYTWREDLLDPGELWCQAQLELKQWSCLLNATGCHMPPSYVPYKGTYVPYAGTFGAPDQGQTLDV